MTGLMRIALIDPSLFTLPYDAGLIEGLTSLGHDVTLHGRALRREDGGLGAVRLSEDFYRVAGSRAVSALPGKARLAIKGADHAWSMWRLLAQLRRTRPDVIHFQWLPLPMVDGALLRQFRAVAPLVLTVHDTDPFNGDPSAALQARGFRQGFDGFLPVLMQTADGGQQQVLCLRRGWSVGGTTRRGRLVIRISSHQTPPPTSR